MKWPNLAAINGILMWGHGFIAAVCFYWRLPSFSWFFIAMASANAFAMAVSLIAWVNDRTRLEEYHWCLRELSNVRVKLEELERTHGKVRKV